MLNIGMRLTSPFLIIKCGHRSVFAMHFWLPAAYHSTQTAMRTGLFASCLSCINVIKSVNTTKLNNVCIHTHTPISTHMHTRMHTLDMHKSCIGMM